jgi:hypothetical protein
VCNVVVVVCACGVLAEALFSRVVARAYRWSVTQQGGDEPQVFRRRARFYLDSDHDFVLEMAPDHLARIKVHTTRPTR